MTPSFDPSWRTRLPYRDLHPRFLSAVGRFKAWPLPEQYDELVREVPQARDVRLPRFVTEQRATVARLGGYEQHVAQLSAVPARPGHWHDFFNMSVWAHFPKLRWALNSLHVDPHVGPKDPRNGRAPAQNLSATFDEAGMLVVSTSEGVLDALRALRFKKVFWERREELLSTTRFWLVGHGMFESLLTPHPGLSARSLLLPVPSLPPADAADAFRFEIDELAAVRIHAWRTARDVLDPVPVLAIPGYSENDSADFYDDPQNIRFEPISRRPGAPAGDPRGAFSPRFPGSGAPSYTHTVPLCEECNLTGQVQAKRSSSASTRMREGECVPSLPGRDDAQ